MCQDNFMALHGVQLHPAEEPCGRVFAAGQARLNKDLIKLSFVFIRPISPNIVVEKLVVACLAVNGSNE
jgi:hypothetical protein